LNKKKAKSPITSNLSNEPSNDTHRISRHHRRNLNLHRHPRLFGRDSPRADAQSEVSTFYPAMTWAEQEFTRNVWCAVIEQAVADMEDKTFQRSDAQNLHNHYRGTAKAFLTSKFFHFLCNELELPADKIQRKAFK
jgi:hypothetical protein